MKKMLKKVAALCMVCALMFALATPVVVSADEEKMPLRVLVQLFDQEGEEIFPCCLYTGFYSRIYVDGTFVDYLSDVVGGIVFFRENLVTSTSKVELFIVYAEGYENVGLFTVDLELTESTFSTFWQGIMQFDFTPSGLVLRAGVEPDSEQPIEEPTEPVATETRTLRFTIGSTTFTDNNANRTLEAAPFIQNDRTMVPLRVIGEALGATDLAHNAGVITFNINGQAFTMTVGQELPGNMGTPVIVAGRTFVPLAFIINEMGATARWDGSARAAYIYTN